MALATYKDLCLDAVDPDRLAAFWADTLGLRVAERRPTLVRLDGDLPGQRVWVNRVPEPHTVKNRVHLDVHASGPEALVGATPVSADGEHPWRIMRDPEGNEVCVFTRAEVPTYRLYEVGVDAADDAAMAAWWGDVLGVPVHRHEQGWHWIEGVPGMPFELVWAPVPEPKTVKNRVHWDVDVAGPEAIAELVERGATILRSPDDTVRWTVMADPEGNEFCAFVPE
jgi:catechol 2,3-dioxygenase-like lactoylglutathione lyase family enzyme